MDPIKPRPYASSRAAFGIPYVGVAVPKAIRDQTLAGPPDVRAMARRSKTAVGALAGPQMLLAAIAAA